MEQQNNKQEDEVQATDKGQVRVNLFRLVNLELVIAVCAILISAASFYATYLQADAANKQVTVMTMPLLRYDHGNYDLESENQQITLRVINGGLGPARVEDFRLYYQSEPVSGLPGGLMESCCAEEWEVYKEEVVPLLLEMSTTEGGYYTNRLPDSIIPGQSSQMFFFFDWAEENNEVWQRLNDERWKTKLDICYCSLLDDCYRKDVADVVTEVKSCEAIYE